MTFRYRELQKRLRASDTESGAGSAIKHVYRLRTTLFSGPSKMQT